MHGQIVKLRSNKTIFDMVELVLHTVLHSKSIAKTVTVFCLIEGFLKRIVKVSSKMLTNLMVHLIQHPQHGGML